jgi:hypothetical protein
MRERAQLLRRADSGVLKVVAPPPPDRRSAFEFPASLRATTSSGAG